MYAELHCLSNFSFQRGANSARELFERARVLGYAALAITDECSLAGSVRAFGASRETGVPLIVGSEFALAEGPRCVLLVRDQAGYSLLCALITQARRRAAKGRYQARRADWERLLQPARAAGTLADSLYALWLPEFEAAEARAQGSGPRAQQEPARRITGVQSDHLASETQSGLHWLQH